MSNFPGDLRPIGSPEDMERDWQSREAVQRRKRDLERRIEALPPEQRTAFINHCRDLGGDVDRPEPSIRWAISAAILAANADTADEDSAAYRARSHDVLTRLEAWRPS